MKINYSLNQDTEAVHQANTNCTHNQSDIVLHLVTKPTFKSTYQKKCPIVTLRDLLLMIGKPTMIRYQDRVNWNSCTSNIKVSAPWGE